MPRTRTKVVSTDEWATPRWLFDHFDAEFHFTLDACARPWNAKCAAYNRDIDWGLPWTGEIVWMNPPYSALGHWMAKAQRESENGVTVACLVPCVPDRKWWAASVEGKAEIRLLTRSLLPSGRVHFEREDGSSDRAPFASCLIVYRGAE